MCKTHNPRVIDKCLRILIDNLREYYGDDYTTVASCCGHGKYPMTLLFKDGGNVVTDWCSNKIIPRKKRFYVKDKQGYYYIPETLNSKT